MLTEVTNLLGGRLSATDGNIGTVEDFYFDDESWTIRYLLADTAKWLPGRKVLIPSVALESIDRAAKSLVIKLSKDQIKNSPERDLSRQSIKSGPEYDSSISLDRDYEERLHKDKRRQY
jgi:hypothetical protein